MISESETNEERLRKMANRFSIRKACETQNLDILKQLLPTPKALVDYQDDNGNNILHLLMYSSDKANGASYLDFAQKILDDYKLNTTAQVFKYPFFMHRNHKNKLPADSSFAIKISSKTEKTKFDEDKLKLYMFLKTQIISRLPRMTKLDAHKIAAEQNEIPDIMQDKILPGTPVSNAWYLPQKNSTPGMLILNSVKEQYPEIRIRVIGDSTKGVREKSYAITGLDPNSKLSLKDQIYESVDFPEDIVPDTVRGINLFESDYKNLRKNQTAFAMYRYFNQLRGVVVIEDREDGDAHITCPSGYSGYATRYSQEIIEKETKLPVVKKYPIIVVNSSSTGNLYTKNNNDWENQERILYHELFHQIDLTGDTHFSDLDIFKYATMLIEQDRANKIIDPFDGVNLNYSNLVENYNIEVAAQIMGVVSPDIYKDSPLLSRIYKLGSCFIIAKANGNNNVLKYLKQADASFLFAEYIRFMGKKSQLPDYTENMTQTEKESVMRARETLLKQQKEIVDETKRKENENKLIKIMDEVIKNAENMLSNSVALQKSMERD